MAQQLSGLAYGNVSLATGGSAGLLARLQRREHGERARLEARKAEFAAFAAEVRASKLALPDQRDLTGMVATRELSIMEAREMMAGLLNALPWYAR